MVNSVPSTRVETVASTGYSGSVSTSSNYDRDGLSNATAASLEATSESDSISPPIVRDAPPHPLDGCSPPSATARPADTSEREALYWPGAVPNDPLDE